MPDVVMWFRRDLRIADNKALIEAVARATDGGAVYPVFCVSAKLLARAPRLRLSYLGSALRELDSKLDNKLNFCYGDPVDELVRFTQQVGARLVVATREFSPLAIARDLRAKEAFRANGIDLLLGDSPYLVSPGKLTGENGAGYSEFSSFSRSLLSFGYDRPWEVPNLKPLTARVVIHPQAKEFLETNIEHDQLAFPHAEGACLKNLSDFCTHKLSGYSEMRNYPGSSGTSQLSPAIRFGILHPRTIADMASKHARGDVLIRELIWRDYFAQLTYRNSSHLWRNANESFDPMIWDSPTNDLGGRRLNAWKLGQTGFPIVDAGMRQLNETGWMHNRVRMIVASFLVKDLHLDWRIGAQHFMDKLIDGDVSSNNQSWQWVAGTGINAAPFSRIFNTTAQSKKFDPKGVYILRWVPELSSLSGLFLHDPSSAKKMGLLDLDVYPDPIVDHEHERLESLSRYNALETGDTGVSKVD